MNTEQIVQDEVENFVLNTEYVLLADPLRHAIRQAIKREREACAMEAEYEAARWLYAPEINEPCKSIAQSIRARGNE
jgi:hypothetical protein